MINGLTGKEMIMSKILFSILTVVFLSLSNHANAANYSNPIDGVFNGIYGDTIYVQVPSQVSKSHVTGNETGGLSFLVNSNTYYHGFNQLTDLKIGDPVRVDYKEDLTGKMKQQYIATNITRTQEPRVVNYQATAPVGTVPSGNTAVTTTGGPSVTTTTTTATMPR